MESPSPFVEHYEFVDVFLLPFLSFKSKAKRTECFVEKKARSIFRRKLFTNGEAQVQEFGDGKAKNCFIGAVK